MLALEGIPEIYIHSLLGTSNDYEGLARTGRYRSINRHVWKKDEIVALLDNPDSMQSIILGRLGHLISGERLEEEQTALELQPYQTVWLTNR